MLDCECNLISADQHTHWWKTAFSKQAQILWVLSWKLSSHAVLQMLKIWAHCSSLLSKSEVWFLCNFRAWWSQLCLSKQIKQTLLCELWRISFSLIFQMQDETETNWESLIDLLNQIVQICEYVYCISETE